MSDNNKATQFCIRVIKTDNAVGWRFCGEVAADGVCPMHGDELYDSDMNAVKAKMIQDAAEAQERRLVAKFGPRCECCGKHMYAGPIGGPVRCIDEGCRIGVENRRYYETVAV